MADSLDDSGLDNDLSKSLSKRLLQHQGINKALKDGYFTMKDLIGLMQEYEHRLEISSDLVRESKLDYDKAKAALNGIVEKTANINVWAGKNLKLQRDLSSVYDAEAQSMSDLVLKRAMIATGLRGEYAQFLATYMIEKGISDINDERLDTLKQNLAIRQKANEAIEHEIELYEHVAKMQLEVREELEKYSKGWEKIKATTKAIFQDKAFAKGVLFAGLIAGAEKLHHKMHDFMEVGMTAGEGIAASFKSTDIYSIMGLSKSDEVVKSIATQYGNLNTLTKEQVSSVGHMASSYGLAGDEALNLTMAVSRLPGQSRDTAINFEKTVLSVGKMKGVMPSQIMKEMAKNADKIAIYSKGGAEGFAKAAATAKRMGVELSNILNAARKTLDFESSINAQMEASVLLGREINMDRLREATLSGDANAILREQQNLIRQAGGLDKMNLLQKEKLAEVMGLTVDEMQRMNDEAQTQNKYFGEQASTFDNILGTSLKMGGGLVTGFEKLMPLLVSMSALMSLMGAKSIPQIVMGVWSMVKGLILGVAQATLLLAKFIAIGVASIFGKGDQAKKMLFGDKGVGESVKGLFGKKEVSFADKRQMVLDRQKAGGGLTPKTPEAPGGGAGPTDQASKVGKLKVGDMLKGAAALLIVSAALYVAAKAFQEFATVKWQDVALGVGGIIGLSVATKIIAKGSSEMIKGAIAVAILGAALIPFAYAMSLIAGLDIGSVLAAAAGLVIFSAAVFGLGAIMMTGVGAAVFGAGLLALAGLGVAMIFLGKGLQMVTEPMKIFSDSMAKMIQSMDPTALLKVAIALPLLALGIYGLAASTLFILPAVGVLTLLGAGIAAFGKLIGFAAPGIESLAKSLTSLSTISLSNLKGIGSALTDIVPGVKSLSDASPNIFVAALSLNMLGTATSLLAQGSSLASGAVKSLGDSLYQLTAIDIKLLQAVSTELVRIAVSASILAQATPMLLMTSVAIVRLGGALMIFSVGANQAAVAIKKLQPPLTALIRDLTRLVALTKPIIVLTSVLYSLAKSVIIFGIASMFAAPMVKFLANSMSSLGTAMLLVSKNTDKVKDFIVSVAASGGGLIKAALGLAGLSVGLVAFSGAALIAFIPLKLLSYGLDSIKKSLHGIGTDAQALTKALQMLSSIDDKKLKRIGDSLASIAKSFAVMGNASSLMTPVLEKLATPVAQLPAEVVKESAKVLPVKTQTATVTQTTTQQTQATRENNEDIKALASELRSLIGVLKAGSVINMDGQKVADIVQRRTRTFNFTT